jgi:hypothetical protein
LKNSIPPEAKANRPFGIGFLWAVKRGKGNLNPQAEAPDYDVGGGRGEKSKVGIKRFRRPSKMLAKNI